MVEKAWTKKNTVNSFTKKRYKVLKQNLFIQRSSQDSFIEDHYKGETILKSFLKFPM